MHEQTTGTVKAMRWLRRLYWRICGRLWRSAFPGSSAYWQMRYQRGGTSGSGSYGELARWKADVINAFVAEHAIQSIIDFGCGDGNNLSFALYPKYIGLDVSPTAIRICSARFAEDSTKAFFLYEPSCFVDKHGLFRADLTLSLDVIFHLVEDDVYHAYMKHLFEAARRFVIIYSSDFEDEQNAHERRRQFSTWVSAHFPEWCLTKRMPNAYPFDAIANTGSLSSFYMYRKSAATVAQDVR